jgi:hypothetical protein
VTTDYLDIYEALLRRSLERGVPTGVVAEVFELPVDVVKDMAKEVKVERFGTADQGEYLENLQWQTLERTEQMIRTGSPDQVARISTAVFGKQIQAAGRRPSSALEEQRAELMDAFRDIREGGPRQTRAGRFVVGNVATDRRAHRVDEDEDDA